MDIAYSVNGIPIRLTYERWYHIIENHDDLASYFFEVLERAGLAKLDRDISDKAALK